MLSSSAFQIVPVSNIPITSMDCLSCRPYKAMHCFAVQSLQGSDCMVRSASSRQKLPSTWLPERRSRQQSRSAGVYMESGASRRVSKMLAIVWDVAHKLMPLAEWDTSSTILGPRCNVGTVACKVAFYDSNQNIVATSGRHVI